MPPSSSPAVASSNPNTVHILNSMCVLSLVSIPFKATFPAGLNLHIGTSLFLVALQTVILHRPAVYAKLQLPPLPKEGGGSKEGGMPTLRDTYEYAKVALRKRMGNSTSIEEAIGERRRRQGTSVWKPMRVVLFVVRHNDDAT